MQQIAGKRAYSRPGDVVDVAILQQHSSCTRDRRASSAAFCAGDYPQFPAVAAVPCSPDGQ